MLASDVTLPTSEQLPMDTTLYTRRLRANVAVFAALIEGVGNAQARWKPTPHEWSILEVVGHLADEEVLDFRTRLDLTLHRPEEAWQPIDPPRWAVERGYNEGSLEETFQRFADERTRSLAWLEALDEPDWDRRHVHPRLGEISAGDLLTSWVGHDLIHMRQINRLHRQYLVEVQSPYSADYAGSW